MIRNQVAAVVYMGIVTFFNVAASAAEPVPKPPGKPRLLPRALPGGSTPSSGAEERVARKPVTAGLPGAGVGAVHADEKARIGVIRRGEGNVQIRGCAPSLPAEIKGLNRDKPVAPDRSSIPPVRPGKIRVLPKSEIKTDAAFEIAAQQVP